MITPAGNSLNKRHQELNTKVNDAVKKEINFEEIKDNREESDIDKLFKIDLASKYKKIDYILEVLKSGDSLYISRALKCNWIVDDEFSQFINPQYLERNIIPFMALKMKRKLLTTISTRLRNGERAEEFHHYCMRNRMYKIGMNFLLYTNEPFKIEILTLHPHVYNDFNRNPEYVERFIGNSFLLADHYLKVVSDDTARSEVLYKLRYLYSVSEDQYLDLLETYKPIEAHYYSYWKTSFKLSQDIMRKHKKRVLKDPVLYLRTLQSDVVDKYSTCDDAKVYASAFFPKENECDSFWYGRYYTNNEYYLKLIPLGERFDVMKKLFTEKYPGEPFEDDYRFFTFGYYESMTAEQKENWSLHHIATEKEMHGCGNDYIWYQFINFKKAFVELKKYILMTADNEKRTKILVTMVDSAKTQEELTILLQYYYNKHINERKEFKREFINRIIERNNVLDFQEECWNALEKIFYSLEVYHKLNEDNSDYQYRILSLLYYIVHEKPVKEVIHEFILSWTISVSNVHWLFEKDLDTTKKDKIYKYLFSFLSNHIQLLMEDESTKGIEKTDRHIHDLLELISNFDKTKEEIPRFIYDYIMREDKFKDFKSHHLFLHKPPPEFKISDIMHYLKEDASLVVSKFSAIKEYFQTRYPKRNINWLIRKLSIYFRYDIAPEFFKLLNDCLSGEELSLQTARVVVFGIFNLSDEDYKIKFLEKYLPVDSTIDHVNISRALLTIQTAICSVACQSRPPLDLSSLRPYISGDYLQYCIPIFDSYLAKLTPSQCLNFVESLLNTPVSVQKHGLRLAFHCFSVENLKNLVLKVWKNTKNVSLRKILYKSLFNKVNYWHDNPAAQWELFGVLMILTHDLHQDDDDEVFALLGNELPPNVYGQHLQAAYVVLNTFPKRKRNYERLTRIVNTMESKLGLVSDKVLLTIYEEHVDTMLEKDHILNTDLTEGHSDLINAKWNLIKTVLIKHKVMHYIYLINDKILAKWHKIHDGAYVYQKFYTDMLYDLETLSYRETPENYLELNNIFRIILDDFSKAIPPVQIYLMVWRLKLNILTREVLGEELVKINDEDETANAQAKELILKFSFRVQVLMKEYIESKKYFSSFNGEILSFINDALFKVTDALSNFFNGTDDDIHTYINILLCSELLKYDVREMHIFVMHFLFSNCSTEEYLSEYVTIVNKLKSLDDEEVKYYLHHKFYNYDFSYKDFMAQPLN